MTLFAWIVLSLLLLARPVAAEPTQLTIVQPAEATTMDPGRSTQVLTVNYFYNLYDSLTRWDAALQLQPGLATSWKAVNDITWEFTLRPGVKFHDGSPLTAEDVRATIERNLVPGKTVVTAGFTTIESVQAASPTLVRVVTRKPDPLLPVRMAQMGSQILPARLTTDEGAKELARRPIGSGAYRFVEWVKDERLVMEANRDWWGWEGRPPSVDRVLWKAIPDDFPRLVALEKGDADIVTSVPPDRIRSVAEGRNTRVVSVPSTRTVEFNINSTQPPLSDKRVRQALHYALDVPAIIRSLFAGLGRPLVGGLADTDFGYNPALKPYPYDPARARALLAEAGSPGGIDVTLHAGMGTMVNDKQLLEVIADMWAKVSIRARVAMMEMGARQRMVNERALPPGGLLLINVQSTLLDADGSLWRILHPTGLGGRYWAGSQPGHRFHEVMEQARYTLDPKKRKALYVEATQLFDDEKPWLELFQEVIVYGTSKRVTFRPRPDFRLIVSEMTIAPR
ncbi:MAG TPA: ABC transporter substrate-binding protein [Candidatus Dormibacteraeota bacterium]|nr:ABC transporter substrate-binding protein [Candidatus Dormibacteraeota bacterium]